MWTRFFADFSFPPGISPSRRPDPSFAASRYPPEGPVQTCSKSRAAHQNLLMASRSRQSIRTHSMTSDTCIASQGPDLGRTGKRTAGRRRPGRDFSAIGNCGPGAIIVRCPGCGIAASVRAVTAAQGQGLLPQWRALEQNLGSIGLARRLGLQLLGSQYSFEPRSPLGSRRPTPIAARSAPA